LAKALWHINQEVSEIREVKPPRKPEKYTEIQAEYSLISTGTERLVSLGKGLTSAEEYMAWWVE